MRDPVQILRDLSDNQRWDVDMSADTAAQRLRDRRRRRVTIGTGLLAAAAAITVVGVIVTGGHDGGPGKPSAVPWRSLPAPLPAALAASESTTVPACSDSDLAASSPGAGTVAGQFQSEILIKNVSGTVCSLGGTPSQIALQAPGASKTLSVANAGNAGAAMVLMPKGVVRSILSGRCAALASSAAPSAERLTVTVEGLHLRLPRGYLPTSVQCSYSATPVEAVPSDADAMSYPALVATAEPPGSAPPGETLNYTITLRNTGETPVTFGADCPTYTELLGPSPQQAASYRLSCSGSANTIPAGGSLAFSMKMDVPTAAAGTMKLAWIMSGVTAGGAFTVA